MFLKIHPARLLSSKRVAFVKKHYVMNNMNRARFLQKRTDRRKDGKLHFKGLRLRRANNEHVGIIARDNS